MFKSSKKLKKVEKISQWYSTGGNLSPEILSTVERARTSVGDSFLSPGENTGGDAAPVWSERITPNRRHSTNRCKIETLWNYIEVKIF